MKHPEIPSTCFFWLMLMASTYTGLKLLSAIGAAEGIGRVPTLLLQGLICFWPTVCEQGRLQENFLGVLVYFLPKYKRFWYQVVSHKKMYFLIGVQGLEWKVVSSWVWFYIWKFIKSNTYVHMHTYIYFHANFLLDFNLFIPQRPL